MKLWLISQSVNDDYDTYDSAVVAAETEEDARKIHPAGYYQWIDNKWFAIRTDGSRYEEGCYGTWANVPDVKVELLGTAVKGQEQGIICASFNAG